MDLQWVDVFRASEPWTREARPGFVKFMEVRLDAVKKALGERDWLAGPFSIADIVMVTVLRELRHTDILAGIPGLAAYQQRGEDRPAFKQALADQAADLGEPVPLPVPA